MRKFILLTLFISSRLFASTTPETYTETLPNGVQIVLQQDRTKPRIAVTALIRTDYFPQKTYGVSHLVQHLLMGGKASKEVNDLKKEMQIYTNASFVEDAAWFDADMPRSALPAYLKASRAQLGTLDTSVNLMDESKEQISSEYVDQIINNFLPSAVSMLKSRMFEQPNYAFGTEGPDEYINKVTPDLLNEYYLNNYRASSITLSIVGDFDTKDTLALIRKEWAGFPEKRVEKPAFQFFNHYKPLDQHTVRIKLAEEKVSIVLGYEMPDARHTDTAALDVLIELLEAQKGIGSFAESKLKGKVNKTYAANHLTLHPHVFMLAADGKDKVDAKELKDGLISALQDVVSNPESKDWEKARDRTMEKFVTRTSDRIELARNLAIYSVFYGSYLSYYGRVEEYKKVTFHDLQRVIYTYFLSKKPHELILRRELDPI